MSHVAKTSLGILASLLVLSSSVAAQGDPNIELLRSDIQANKVAIMTEAMEFTEEQAEKFWPIYREFQFEMGKIGDERVALIKDFATNYENMTDDVAKELGQRWFEQQEDQLKLVHEYYEEVAKALGPVVAARFAQVENRLQMMLNLQLAAELPLIK